MEEIITLCDLTLTNSPQSKKEKLYYRKPSANLKNYKSISKNNKAKRFIWNTYLLWFKSQAFTLHCSNSNSPCIRN